MRTLAAASLVVLALVAAPSTASARKTKDLAHRYEQVWSAVIRLLRVDMHARIEEQDATNGFVLFGFREGGHGYEASLELVRVEVRGVPIVRVAVNIANAPSYLEAMLLERLHQKLRQDYGEPIVRPQRSPDAGVADVRDAGAADEPSDDSSSSTDTEEPADEPPQGTSRRGRSR
ncbi:MAG: hypothetical protein U0230_07575 [Polyangiales bacterium]